MALPTTDAVIAETEAELAVRLPAWLRERLMRDNGGELAAADDVWTLFAAFDRRDRKRMSRSAVCLTKELPAARAWVGFPANAVPIGSNGSGDLLVLLPTADDQGVLAPNPFRWDHETGRLHAARVPRTP